MLPHWIFRKYPRRVLRNVTLLTFQPPRNANDRWTVHLCNAEIADRIGVNITAFERKLTLFSIFPLFI